MSKSYILISSDFKPMMGGVAEFSLQIAESLAQKNLLSAILTTVSQPKKSRLPIISPRKKYQHKLANFILTKVNGLNYYLFLFRCLGIILLTKHKSDFVFCFVDGLFARQLINFLVWTKANFHVLFHGKDIIHLRQKYPLLMNSICINSKSILFNSYATKQLFFDLVGDKINQSFILHPTLRTQDLERLSVEPIDFLQKLKKDDIVICTVCRLVKRKGIHFAIQAFLELSFDKCYQNIYFLIAGEGDEKEYLMNLASIQKDKIFFLGNITDGQKKSLLVRSSIFIMPNYSINSSDFEGFGISFLEAAYFGNVVIGGNSGGVRDAIKKCPQGILVDTDGEESMVILEIKEKLKLVLDSLKMKKISFTDYNDRYTNEWQKQIDMFISFNNSYT